MIETLIGVMAGSTTSWLITHIYYKKQKNEELNELIEDTNDKVKNIYKMSSVKEDEELKEELDELISMFMLTRHKIMSLVTPLVIDAQGLKEAYENKSMEEFTSYLGEALPDMLQSARELETVRDELDRYESEIEDITNNEYI